jgi:predicted flavoprotein YhiN
MDQQEQQQEQVSSTLNERVTKRETKVKNPKRIEQGKRLAEHNRKMKLQLAQMQQAEPVQDNDPKAIDSRLLYAGGIVLLGGLAFLELHK